MENTLYLTIGAPVLLTRNLFVEAGLFNAAWGEVVDIIYGTKPED